MGHSSAAVWIAITDDGRPGVPSPANRRTNPLPLGPPNRFTQAAARPHSRHAAASVEAWTSRDRATAIANATAVPKAIPAPMSTR